MSEGPPPREPGSIPGLSRMSASPFLGPIASSQLNQPGLGKVIKNSIQTNAWKKVSRLPSTFVLPFEPGQTDKQKFTFSSGVSSGTQGGKQKTRRYRKQRKQRKHVKKSRKQRK